MMDGTAAIGDEMERSSISSPMSARSNSSLTYTVAVYAVLSSWWDGTAAIGDEMELCSISSPIAARSSSCLTYTVAVYAVLSSWWDGTAAIGDEMERSSISSPMSAPSNSCLTYTVAVYAVLSSWWWTELLLSEMRWNAVPSHPRCQHVAAAFWHIPLLYTQFWAPDDGRKGRPKHVESFTRINNLR